MERSNTATPVKAAETTLSIIDLLQEMNGGYVTEVADRLEIANSTAYRHLSTLERNKYVVKEDGVYHLSAQFVNIGEGVKYRKQSYEMVAAKVEELAEQTGERVQFAIEEHGKAMYLHRAMGDQAVSTDVSLSEPLYLHSIAAGKAILSRLDNSRIEAIIDAHGLPQLTPQTITSREALFEELDEIRDRGYAYNLQEQITGLNAIAAPVDGPDERVLGALTIAGPMKRMNQKQFKKELPDIITGTANELEINIAYADK